MNEVFRAHLDKFVVVYLDDILVFSNSEEEHEQHLRWVFEKLRQHALHAKRRKCAFALDRLEYLGHIVTPQGVSVDPYKTEAVRQFKPPTCK